MEDDAEYGWLLWVDDITILTQILEIVEGVFIELSSSNAINAEIRQTIIYISIDNNRNHIYHSHQLYS